MNIAIETQSTLTLGATVIDTQQRSPRPINAHWVTDVDCNAFLQMITEGIQTLSQSAHRR